MQPTEPLELISKDKAELKVNKIKSQMIMRIFKYKNDSNLTQAKMAEICGVTQPRISNVIKGCMSKVSIDGLVRICDKLGINVEIKI